MRIIGGEHRGRKIIRPEAEATRPTKDRIRESVFNIVSERLPDSDILDIFAGSGAYGLEALSRGAKRAVFVDNSKYCASIIKNNINTLNVKYRSKVIISDAFETIEQLYNKKEKFDLLFADPPYNTGLAKKTLIKVNQYDILNEFGLLIIEHHVEEVLPQTGKNVTILKKKTYGDTNISIYIKNGENSDLPGNV